MSKKVGLEFTWISEAEKFFKDNFREGYKLQIYNNFEDNFDGNTCEILCKYEDMVDVLNYVVHLEHDYPSWIGIDDNSNSYVIGMSFTRGRINTPGTYEWKNSKLVKIDEYPCKQDSKPQKKENLEEILKKYSGENIEKIVKMRKKKEEEFTSKLSSKYMFGNPIMQVLEQHGIKPIVVSEEEALKSIYE